MESRYTSDRWWTRLVTWTRVREPCQQNRHGECTGDCDCALNGHGKNPGRVS